MGSYTQDDIDYIATTLRQRKDSHPDRPFVMLTGAGCSKSGGIPLASEFVKLINDEYSGHCTRRLNEKQRSDYGACMSALPTSDRKALLDRYLDKAKVNWGHVAMAAMMEAGYIGRVLTFNFDSLLAQACGLLGFYPATYDFVTGATGEMNLIAPRAIIHLHGQGNGIAMMNTGQQTKDHAASLKPLFDHILSEYPVIAIGYSGESDETFATLNASYSGGQWFYWAGYDKSPKIHISKFLKKGENSAEFFGDADADRFLMDLADALECWPPKLFTNAYEHLLEELEMVGPFPKSDYDLLEELKSELRTKRNDKALQPKNKLENLLTGNFEALSLQTGDKPDDPTDKELLAFAKFDEALLIHEGQNAKVDDLKIASKLYAKATSLKPNFFAAFNNWGNALSSIASLTGDKNFLYESFEKYAEAISIKSDFYIALYNWGDALLRLYNISSDSTYLKHAIVKLEEAKDLYPDNLYNLACAYALQGNTVAAKEALLRSETTGYLPDRKHLEADDDLASLRELDWFKDLLSRQD